MTKVFWTTAAMHKTWSSIRRKTRTNNFKLLEEEINHLELIGNLPELTEKLQDAKNKLQEIRKEHIKGLFVRSKVKWIENEEKPSKYFLSLEKRNYINKTVNKLMHDSVVQ